MFNQAKEMNVLVSKMPEQIKKNKVSKEEQMVIDMNSPSASYDYCYRNNGANVKKHQDIVIKNKDAKYAFYFAKDIKGTDKRVLKKLIVKICESEDRYYNIAQYYKYVSRDIMKVVERTYNSKFIEGCKKEISGLMK